MNDDLYVPRGEQHVLRLFALDISREDAERLRDAPGRDRALGALLGLDRLDPAQVELVDIADLEGVGLARFLIEGDGAAEVQITADQPRLDALQGQVMIVASGAFDPAGATLRPASTVRLEGVYREDVPGVRFEPLPQAGARGVLTPPAPPSGPAGKNHGTALLVALAGLVLLVLLVVVRLISG